jgi:predicted nucleic acid-binding protein
VTLLDTNVVSEAMRPKPDRNVLAWLDAQIAASRHFSAATRECAPFQAAGVSVINPWSAAPEARMPGPD